MAPGEHLLGKRRKDRFPSDKEVDDLAAEALRKERFGNRRQGVKRPETSKAPSATSACMWGLKLTRSPKVCTKRMKPGRARGCAARYASRSNRAMMRQSSPRGERRLAKNGRVSLGIVKTYCRCGTGRNTLLSTHST
jgi:hypothetical protein